MKRVTPEEVVEAYKKTGFKPLQDEYFETQGDVCAACAFGALYVANGGMGDLGTEVDEFADGLTGSNMYSLGFMMGFDGYRPNRDMADYLIGHEDGKSAWEAVKARE